MRKLHEKIVNFFESRVLVGIFYGVGIIIILGLIFSAGVSVGFHRASFGRAWGENYERNFGMLPSPGFNNLSGPNFPNAHGAVGKIIKITIPSIIVADKDNTEKVILLSSDTKIQKIRTPANQTDLAINDFVVVIGSPNPQGQIEAKFIRIMPAGTMSEFPRSGILNNPPQ